MRQYRKERKLTQEELAMNADLAAITIWHYEKGDRPIPLTQAVKIAGALGITPNDLAGGNAEKTFEEEKRGHKKRLEKDEPCLNKYIKIQAQEPPKWELLLCRCHDADAGKTVYTTLTWCGVGWYDYRGDEIPKHMHVMEWREVPR